MKLIRILSALILVTLMLSAPFAQAAFTPATLSYQGTLNNADETPVSGLKKLTFKLYKDVTGGNAFWTEIQDNVYVTNGRFATVFGAVTTPTANPLNPADFSADVYLGITVSPEVIEMAPRQKMTSVAFAFNATNATNGVPVGGIIMWSGTVAPTGWALCNGSNGTPDLRDRFIIGAGSTYAAGAIGGSKDHFHKADNSTTGTGGNMKAAISTIAGSTKSYDISPENPNDSSSKINYTLYQWFITTAYNYVPPLPNLDFAVPVFGYTSIGYQGIPVYGANGAASAGSLPPYYALAYIIKQ